MKIRLLVIVIATIFAGIFVLTPSNASIFNFDVCAETEPEQKVSEACLELMESYPVPSVLDIPQDKFTLSNYSFWKVESPQGAVFDAPGGNIVREIGQGFNFVNVINTQPGWVQIEGGGWMQEADVRFVEPSYFTGVKVLDGLQNRFAWVLGTFYTSAYPGGPQDSENGRLLFRYDLVNLFAEAYDEEGWRWYMVGPDQWIEQRVVAKPLPVERPEDVTTKRWVAVDLYEQTLVAFENETPVFATLIASGLPGWDTNEGVFDVWASLPADRMAGATGAPDAYDLQSVPWVMYFDDSISLHGTYWHDNFGYRRSHGCVNLSISDARHVFEWMFEGVEGDAEANMKVYVYASGEYRKGGAATK